MSCCSPDSANSSTERIVAMLLCNVERSMFLAELPTLKRYVSYSRSLLIDQTPLHHEVGEANFPHTLSAGSALPVQPSTPFRVEYHSDAALSNNSRQYCTESFKSTSSTCSAASSSVRRAGSCDTISASCATSWSSWPVNSARALTTVNKAASHALLTVLWSRKVSRVCL